MPGTIKSFSRQFEITLSTSIKALLYDVTFNGSDSVITVVSVSKRLSLYVIALLGQDLRVRLPYKRWCVFFLNRECMRIVQRLREFSVLERCL